MIAAEAFFRQPHLGFEEVSPLVERVPLDQPLPLQLRSGWLHAVNWKRADVRWGPVLARFVPLAAIPYHHEQHNLIRAQNQLGELAKKALKALNAPHRTR
jgi:hypothetical protein